MKQNTRGNNKRNSQLESAMQNTFTYKRDTGVNYENV